MTATGRVRASSKKPGFWERTLTGLRTYFAPDDIITLPVLIVLLLMPALALEAADWPLSQGVLVPVITLSSFMGLILARSRFNELLALIVGATYGVCLVLVLTAIVEVGSITTGAYTVFVRAVQWGVDAVTGGVNPDDLVLTLLVSVLFWFLGYNAAWHAFRIDRVWRVILPPGLILLTNTAFYPGDRDLTWYLVGFTFSALLLVVRSNLDAREWEWYTAGVRAPRYLRHQFMLVGAVLSMLTMVVAWGAPSGNLDERLESFKEFLQSEPLERLTEFWNRLFSSVDAHGPTTADYYGGDRLDLGGAIRLGDQTVFLVSTTPGRRYYWRSRVFDTYEGGSWTSAADTRLTDNRAPSDIIYEETRSRVLVEQEFTMALGGSRLVYAAPQPVRVDVSTRTDLRYVPNAEDPNRFMNLSVIRPTQVIRRGDTYTASSLVSTASAFELRVAGTDYPGWVRDTYLYVSPTVTDRTVELARQIITDSGATNPYDQAKAIESWLRANITYNETIPRPPSNQDPVDWVLFDYRQGYCNYYASAMIVMLRTLGIPARMAAGFAQGTYDPAEGVYMVTERDAHTWVEAYFPGYGWIEFEPTAAQAPLEREGDGEFTEQIAPPPQVATATPTPTPSPEPSPTPTPSTPTPQTPTPEQNNPPQATATVTPTFTPTPTATAIIVPTQPAPIEPESRGPLEFILPALGLALLGLLVLVVLVALGTFIWWWWEWRGMKGLSPISRAYARLERYLGLIGMRFNTQQTPEERRRVIVKGIPKAERPVTTITRMYTTERYGPSARRPGESQRTTRAADEAWSSARGNILSRWLRRFVPWLRNRD